MIKKIPQVDICSEKLSSTCSEKLVEIKIDNKLTFEEHVERLCKKASQKVSVLARISSLMRFAVSSLTNISNMCLAQCWRL